MALLPPQMGLPPGLQLRQGEGFHDVVVPARQEALHLVRVLNPGYKEQDGVGHLVPDPSADLQTVHARHVDVQQDDVRRALRLLQSAFAVGGRRDLVAFCGEEAGEHCCYVWFVICYEDSVCHGVCLLCCCIGVCGSFMGEKSFSF